MLKVALRGIFAHKGRLAMSCLAVVLSVAFVTGTMIFTGTINRALDDAAAASAPDVTVTAPLPAGTGSAEVGDAVRRAVVGEGGTLSDADTLVGKVRAVPGVAAAYLDVTVDTATLTDSRGKAIDAAGGMSGFGAKSSIPVLAGNWFDSDRSPVRLAGGRAPQGPDEAMLDRISADRAHVRIGDTIRVVAVPGTFEARVTGIADFKAASQGNTRVYVDTATAQRRLLGRPGAATSIGVDAAAGVTPADLRRSLAAALGDAVQVQAKDPTAVSPDNGAGQTTDFLGMVMTGFAGVAVLVGVLLIFNTFSMLVGARTRELGLLRAIGASRRQVNRSVLLEALVLGLLGSTLGIGAGIGLAVGLHAAMASFGLDLGSTPLVVGPAAVLVGYAVGTVATLAAGVIPARRAGRIPAMAALREAAAPSTRPGRGRTLTGAVLLLAGAGLLIAGHAAAAPGMVLTLIAFFPLGPALVRGVVPVLTAAFPRLFGPMGAIAVGNTLRNPRRTAATSAALMIGICVATAMAVSAASASDSMAARTDRMLGADFIISGQHAQAQFGPEAAGTARRVPGIAEVVRERITRATLTAGATTLSTTVYGDEPGFPTAMHETYTAGDPRAALAHGQIVLVDAMAERLGVGIGDQVTLAGPGGPPVTLTIGAVQRQEPPGMSMGRVRLAPSVGFDVLSALAPTASDTTLFAFAARGADPTAVGKALTTALAGYPQLAVQDRAAYKASVRSSADQMLSMAYGLLALAVVIAVLGVANTMAMSVGERTREIGMLRAVGASRREVRRMVRLESVVITALGAVSGVSLGVAWGIALHRMAGEGQTVLSVPWITLAELVAAAVIAGVLAALTPAARAVRLDILSALAAD
ncbi:ABC transporter permease [Kitasatospora sp. NPDC057541]|uniref:ABC transporter permease n=1 Tax=unclassified Kitasatospora TaxID=2633591 RepID=UPI0036B72568